MSDEKKDRGKELIDRVWLELMKEATTKAIERLVPNILQCTDSVGEAIMASLVAAKAIAVMEGQGAMLAKYIEQLGQIEIKGLLVERVPCDDPTHNHPKPVVH